MTLIIMNPYHEGQLTLLFDCRQYANDFIVRGYLVKRYKELKFCVAIFV